MWKIAGAGLAATAVIAVGTAPDVGSSGAFPGQNGLIAYEVDGSICVMRADGTGRYRVTYGIAIDSGPAWSADGRRLAFARARLLSPAPPRVSSAVVLLGGGKALELSSPEIAHRDDEPSWSPDGRELVIDEISVHWSAYPMVTVIAANGQGRRRLEEGANPAWSPDGELIAYTGLFLIRPDGTGRTRLTTDGGREPSWSPDGRRIAYVGFRGPYTGTGLDVIDRDGTDRRRLIERQISDPVWSPDGSAIAYLQQNDLWVVRAGDADMRNLTKTSDLVERSPDWAPAAEYALPRGARGCGRKLVGGSKRERLTGGRWDDLIYAQGGADDLRGNIGRDLLFGGAGNDLVFGGPGQDDLFGGPGNDTLASADRAADRLFCGPGRDRVVVDRRDLVGRDCERVSRP